MNYVLFMHDPDGVFKSLDEAAMKTDDLLSSYSMNRVHVGVDSETHRVEELREMLNGSIDQWAEAQDLARQTIEDAEYWGVTLLASFKELAAHLGVELKEE